jgi:putative ABC transport system permease protein
LALAIASSTVAFSIFYNILFDSFAAKDAQRLVVPVLLDSDSPEVRMPLTYKLPDLQILRSQNKVFDGIVGYDGGVLLLQDGDQTHQLYSSRVTSDAFDFYGVPPRLGRGISPDDGRPGAPPVFVMSYETWKSEFNADPAVVGKTYTIGDETRTLVGVMPPRFQAFGDKRQIWFPLPQPSAHSPDNTPDPTLSLLARLQPGVSLESASADLDIVVKQIASQHLDKASKHVSASVMTASDFLFGPGGVGAVFNSGIRFKDLLYELLAAVLVLLLIACSNVANLLLVRATNREKELAIRSALGATLGQLRRQLLIENLVLASIAGITGCFVAWSALRLVNSLLHQKAWMGLGAESVVSLNAPVLLFALILVFLTTFFCGTASVWRVRNGDLQSRLVGGGQGMTSGQRHWRIRSSLLVVQVAFSIVLLCGAGLLIRSLYLLTHIDLGFNPDRILVAAFGPPRTRDPLPDRVKLASAGGQTLFYRAVATIKNVPGVMNVAVNNTIPGYGPYRGPKINVPGSAHQIEAGLDECDENCADVLDIHLTRGRWLSKDEVETDQFAIVINQRLANELFGNGNPIDAQLEVHGFDLWKNGLRQFFVQRHVQPPVSANFRVVGVVADVKNAGPQQPAKPMAFIPPIISGGFILQVKTRGNPESLKHAIQDRVWAIDRTEVFWILDPLTEFLREHTLATPEFAVTLAVPMATIALVLALIGIFGVVAYQVSLRTKEIGVRMALGARPRNVLGMVVRQAAQLLGAGIFSGILASYALTRFLSAQIWGIKATDPATFAVVIAVFAVTSLIACTLPARRAARIDPLVALRYE